MTLGIYKTPVTPVDEVAITSLIINPLSEHMWAYFEFSYDLEFKDSSLLVIPEFGEYKLETSQNGIYYEHWNAGIRIGLEDYERQYKLAGYVTHVRFTPTIIPGFTTPPNPGQLYFRGIIARV